MDAHIQLDANESRALYLVDLIYDKWVDARGRR